MHIAQLSPEVRALVPDSPPPFAQVDAVLPTPSPHSGARRRLFFPSSSSPSPGAEGEDDDEAESNRAYVDRLLAEIAAEKARKWGFDFAQHKPLAAATMKNEEDKVSGTLLPSSAAEASQSPFHYFEVSAGEVPGFYRALSSLSNHHQASTGSTASAASGGAGKHSLRLSTGFSFFQRSSSSASSSVEDNDEHLLQKAAMDHQCAAADSEMEHDGSNGHLLQRSSLASRSDEENIHPLLADQDSSSSDHAKPWGLMELDDCGDADEKKGSSGSLRALERSLVDQQQRTPKTGRRTNNNTAKKTVKQQQNTSNKKSATNTTSSLLRQSTLNDFMVGRRWTDEVVAALTPSTPSSKKKTTTANNVITKKVAAAKSSSFTKSEKSAGAGRRSSNRLRALRQHQQQ